MKVYLGKYRSSSLHDLLEPIFDMLCIHDEDRFLIIDFLRRIKIGRWIESFLWKYDRIKFVKIDSWDVWSLDHTLALIILPALEVLKNKKHGAPLVDDNDVPEELRSYNAPPKENEWDTDKFWFDRYDWILNEMIWAFRNIVDDSWEEQFYSGTIDFNFVPCEDNPKLFKLETGPNDTHKFDAEGYKKYQDRITNGLRLFGVYYQGLWD